jgi:hypothetical protein
VGMEVITQDMKHSSFLSLRCCQFYVRKWLSPPGPGSLINHNIACRTLAIWIARLLLGRELLVWSISLLQVVGFGLLVYGTVHVQWVYSLGTKFLFDTSFSVLVQQYRTTTTLLASLSRGYFGCHGIGVGGSGSNVSVWRRIRRARVFGCRS